jgi:hypothetical protein
MVSPETERAIHTLGSAVVVDLNLGKGGLDVAAYR